MKRSSQSPPLPDHATDYPEVVRRDGDRGIGEVLAEQREPPPALRGDSLDQQGIVEAEWDLLDSADIVVLVYPIWFGGPPAMLKGYVERVFGAGRKAGQAQDGAASSRLAGKHLVSLQLSGSMRTWLHATGVMNSLRNLFERYLSEVFGLPETHSYHFDGITQSMSEKDAAYHLSSAGEAARTILAEVRAEWQKDPRRG